MSVLIGHASISEKGTINGTPGDQTGKEVCIRDWYAKPWNVMIVCTDKALAERAAEQMRLACNNNKIGYGQNDRTTAYQSGKKNGKTFKNASGNTDCSQLVIACYIFAGLTQLSPDCYTGNMRKALMNTGKFKEYTDAAHLNSDAYAEVGAVYLKEGSHVVMSLSCGSKAGTSSGGSNTPSAPSGNPIVRDGQIHANNFTGAGIDTDGIRGSETKKAGIMVLQVAMNLDYKAGLVVDGDFGTKSKTALGNHYVKYGETQYLVTAVEILLMLKGYNPNGVECPGEYGSGLKAAVGQYQKDHGLKVDYIAGPATLKSLIA